MGEKLDFLQGYFCAKFAKNGIFFANSEKEFQDFFCKQESMGGSELIASFSDCNWVLIGFKWRMNSNAKQLNHRMRQIGLQLRLFQFYWDHNSPHRHCLNDKTKFGGKLQSIVDVSPKWLLEFAKKKHCPFLFAFY